jgi:hypothetical protein
MKIDRLYFINKSAFTNVMRLWTDEKGIDLTEHPMNEDLLELIDGAVLFHVNHNLNKEFIQLADLIEENNVPTYKVDVNGTLAATLSNFSMWLERNKAKNVLILGHEDVAKSENLNRFLGALFKEKERA